VPGCVDEVQDVLLTVACGVVQANRVRFDRDAALALEIHRIEHLRFHLAGLQRAGQLEETVGQRRLPVIDMRDDRKIADALRVHDLLERH